VATLIELDDMQVGYLQLVDHVMKNGVQSSPRGLLTLDAGYTTFVLNDPTKAAPVGVGRKLSMKLANAETAQLIAGASDVKQLTSIAPVFKRFDVDDRQPGAYGPRLMNQLPQVIRELSTDGETRRAAASIWRPDELERESPDYPCTVMFGWAIRRGRLEMYTTMRSNDLWLGVPYDVIMMTRLQLTIAWALGVRPGPYHHTAWSLHLYVDDLNKIKNLHDPEEIIDCPVQPFTTPGQNGRQFIEQESSIALQRWMTARNRARAEVMHGSDGLLCRDCGYVLPRTTQHFYERNLNRDRFAQCKQCGALKHWSVDKSLAARCAKYGVTVEWYYAQLELQGKKCAICVLPFNEDTVNIDHDHKTGVARGLLCTNCNFALGHLDDDEDRIARLTPYLRGELYDA
jgi:thymidylate synthase